MQLPRGTFREIRKNITVSELLGELEKTGFYGVCNISHEFLTGTFVFKMGSCILADFKTQQGNAAWIELQKISDQDVDAALSTLDEAQIQLSLEFNKTAKITKTSAGSSKAPPRVPAQPAPKVAAASQNPSPLLQTLKSHRFDLGIQPKPQAAPRMSVFSAPSANKKRSEDMVHEECDNFDQDIDTFDSMNLESMTDKIRVDCKSMIKQLDLDHLIEK